MSQCEVSRCDSRFYETLVRNNLPGEGFFSHAKFFAGIAQSRSYFKLSLHQVFAWKSIKNIAVELDFAVPKLRLQSQSDDDGRNSFYERQILSFNQQMKHVHPANNGIVFSNLAVIGPGFCSMQQLAPY
jgi:hypothetical protein